MNRQPLLHHSSRLQFKTRARRSQKCCVCAVPFSASRSAQKPQHRHSASPQPPSSAHRAFSLLHSYQVANSSRRTQSRTLTSLTSPLLRRPQLQRTNLESPTTSILAQTSFPAISPTGNGSALAPLGSATQVRGAKRDTYDPSHLVRKRRHGFLSRAKTRLGRKLLKRRKLKGRSTLSH